MVSLGIDRKQVILINLAVIYQHPPLFTSRGWAEKEDAMLNRDRSKLVNEKSSVAGKM